MDTQEKPVRWSHLKAMAISPKHFLHGLANERPGTDALLLGSVTHCALFEPDKLDVRYVVEPRFHRGQLYLIAIKNGYDGGKEEAAAWDREQADSDRIVVKSEIYASAIAMRAAVLADPVAAPIVTSGWSERKLTWTDPETGIACQGTVDHVNGCLFDFKTTRSLVSFERDLVRFGYHAQLPWYLDGCLLNGIEFTGAPGLIAVESSPPYDVLVLVFEPDDLAVGRRVYRKCLDRLAECRRTGIWPGISNGVSRRVALPPWADPIMEEMDVVIDGQTVKV